MVLSNLSLAPSALPSAQEWVEAILERLPHVTAIWMFGSQATGNAHVESDVDLAVLTPELLDPVALWHVAQSLAAFASRDVDLVDFKTASTVLQYQIITTGCSLYTRDKSALDTYLAFVCSQKTELNERTAKLRDVIVTEGRVYAGG